MCLAILGRIQSIDTALRMAEIDYHGLVKQASTRLAPEAAAGDFVLVHAGFIIQVLPAAEGEELSELAREVGLL